VPKPNLPEPLAIGERIRQIRDFRGYSQEYVATQVGISQQHLSDIEKDAVDPSIKKLMKICSILEIQLSDITGEKSAQSFINSTVQGVNSPVNAPVTNSYNILPEKMVQVYETAIEALRSENALLRERVQ
jgi:transcriptional regulator with XRE-family HTH domain